MAVKALDLFKAFAEEKLPTMGGYIISSFFQETSAYSKYEVVAYNSVKAIYPTSEGLTFQADGNKLFVLAEPANYMKKHIEPYTRETEYQIPHRFSEVETVTARNQTRVMVIPSYEVWDASCGMPERHTSSPSTRLSAGRALHGVSSLSEGGCQRILVPPPFRPVTCHSPSVIQMPSLSPHTSSSMLEKGRSGLSSTSRRIGAYLIIMMISFKERVLVKRHEWDSAKLNPAWTSASLGSISRGNMIRRSPFCRTLLHEARLCVAMR